MASSVFLNIKKKVKQLDSVMENQQIKNVQVDSAIKMMEQSMEKQQIQNVQV